MDDERRMRIALLGLTFSSGLIDALSFIELGHVFTANPSARDRSICAEFEAG